MNAVLWGVQILLLGVYGIAGSLKIFQTSVARRRMTWTEARSDAYIRFVGTTEVLGAAGMLLPMLTGVAPWLTPLAALGLTLVQLVAITTVHLPRREFQTLPMNVVLLALSLAIIIGRWPLLAA